MTAFFCSLFFAGFLMGPVVDAKEIRTNEINTVDAPNWIKQSRIEKVTDRIQTKLEWSTRRVQLHWYTSQEAFNKVHPFGNMATAVTKHVGNSSVIHLGPLVTDKNFDEIFGHELVHVIVRQKYKEAIPKWLEEGLANHLAAKSKVDYKWLAKHPFPKDVHELAHPFSGSSNGVVYRYKASQALAEMLDRKCKLQTLIQLSVQRKLENYISTFCEIKDINEAFRKWVMSRS